MYSVWCTRYGLLAIPTTFFSLLSGEGESEMERERAKATGLAPSFGRRVTPAHAKRSISLPPSARKKRETNTRN